MSNAKSFHMTHEEFRRYGHAVVDWIAEYYQRVDSLSVLSQVEPGQIRASLPLSHPQRGSPLKRCSRTWRS